MSPSGGRTSHIHDQANVELQHLGKLVMWSDTAPPSDTKVINLFFLNVQMLLMSFNAEDLRKAGYSDVQHTALPALLMEHSGHRYVTVYHSYYTKHTRLYMEDDFDDYLWHLVAFKQLHQWFVRMLLLGLATNKKVAEGVALFQDQLSSLLKSGNPGTCPTTQQSWKEHSEGIYWLVHGVMALCVWGKGRGVSMRLRQQVSANLQAIN